MVLELVGVVRCFDFCGKLVPDSTDAVDEKVMSGLAVEYSLSCHSMGAVSGVTSWGLVIVEIGWVGVVNEAYFLEPFSYFEKLNEVASSSAVR